MESVENSSDAVGMSTPEGLHYYQNKAFDELFGAVGENPPATLYVDSNIGREVFDTIMAGGQWTGEVQMYSRHREILTILLRAYASKDASGRIRALVGLHTDITRRKQADERLRFTNLLLLTQQETSLDGILIIGKEGEILLFNQRFAEMWKIPDEILKTRSDNRALEYVISGLADPEEFLQRVRWLYLHTDESSFDEVNLSDGRVFERYSAPMNSNQEYFGRVWYFRDVTERREAEAEREKIRSQLIQAQKMQAIGTLASGIAHDFNNMLGGIMGSLSLLEILLGKETLEQKDAIFEYLMTASDASKRAADLVRQLLLIARKDDVSSVPVDISVALKHVYGICRNSLPKAVELDFAIPEEPFLVLADPVRLEQVFLNICVNASHAMTMIRPTDEREGGTLSVEAAKFVSDDYMEKMHSIAIAGKEFVRISFRDTGVGMSEEVKNHIFEPFYSTKKKGEGTGLGLSVAYGIVQQFGGWISVYSEQGKGTTFQINIPLHQRSGGIVRPGEELACPVPQVETVLLVDDDLSMRKVAAGILENFKCPFFAASNGQEGIDLFREHKDTISLVLLDLSLPGMSGLEILAGLLKIREDVPVILCSGFADDPQVHELVHSGRVGFVQKPYTAAELGKAMRDRRQV